MVSMMLRTHRERRNFIFLFIMKILEIGIDQVAQIQFVNRDHLFVSRPSRPE